MDYKCDINNIFFDKLLLNFIFLLNLSIYDIIWQYDNYDNLWQLTNVPNNHSNNFF